MRFVCLTLGVLSVGSAAVAAEQPGTVLLDQYASWRMFSALKPPEIAMDDGVKAAVYKWPENHWLNGETSPPAADWCKPEFDDAQWLQGPVGMQCRAPFTSRTCFRGKFRVTDPARAKSLKLNLTYHGGIVVYLNGEEIARQHLPKDARLAEAYPVEVFQSPDGGLLVPEGDILSKPKDYGKRSSGDFLRAKKPNEEALRRIAMRDRTLQVELPARLLRQGVNVLALDIVRAPYHKVMDDQKTMSWFDDPMYVLSWYTCELGAAELKVVGEGVESSIERAGLQVWNSPLLRTDFRLDRGDPCEPVRPITLSGPRNGIFSDKVLVGSPKAIRQLKAVAGDLRGPGGVIPAAAVRVRYAVPSGAEYGIEETTYGAKSGTKLAGFWAAVAGKAEAMPVLLDAPPEEYAVLQAARSPGAMAPVWVTVKVPADCKPGSYTGKLTIACEEEKPVEVPVNLRVDDWTLPSPDRFQTWIEVIESPETLQMEYGVPAWSDKHFELIGRSFRLMREVGSKVVYVPLICCTNLGNEESMVRWAKKGEKDYDFDFTVLDKYLDAVQQNLGQPEIVCFIVWDIFMCRTSGSVGGSHQNIADWYNKDPHSQAASGRMFWPFVTLTTPDPQTGKLARAEFPEYFADAANKAQWKKLFDHLHQRMRKRGLEQAMMLGWFNDVRPRREEIDMWREATGDLPWVSHAHNTVYTVGRLGNNVNMKMGITMGYNTSIHDVRRPPDPAKERRYGWKKEPVTWAQQLLRPGQRGEMDMLPGTMWGAMTEITLAGGQRGFGRLGGDMWFVIKNKAGLRTNRIYDRYPWSNWPLLELCCSLLSPGPDGAVATAHFEQLRESVQECEAKIFIEQALSDPPRREKLGADLAQRCQALLDERVLCDLRGVAGYRAIPHAYNSPWSWWFQTGEAGHAWFQSSGWRQRNARLYTLAGEVEKKLAQ